MYRPPKASGDNLPAIQCSGHASVMSRVCVEAARSSAPDGAPLKIVWTNLRVKRMRVGREFYSSGIYGDVVDKNNFLVRGTKKRRDKTMLTALVRGLPVLVTINVGKYPRLPDIIGVGKVAGVRDVPEGFREFRIDFGHIVPDSKQDRSPLIRSPQQKMLCWIKKTFMDRIGLSYTGNLMECSVMCDLVELMSDEKLPSIPTFPHK